MREKVWTDPNKNYCLYPMNPYVHKYIIGTKIQMMSILMNNTT